MDFSKFDKEVDLKGLKEDVAEAEKNGGTGDFPEIPKGVYIVSPIKMEVGETKDGRPMFKVQFKIVEGEFEKQNIFVNRVIYGTKNDAGMIGGVVSFLKSLEPSDEVDEIVFDSYSQFAQLVLDVMEDIEGALEYEIEYDAKAFNSVKVTDVFDA